MDRKTVSVQVGERPSSVVISCADGACTYCGGKNGVQEHHLSPRVLFLDDADEWPRLMLCKRCHNRWHRIVGRAIRRMIEEEREAYIKLRSTVDPDDMLDPLERLEG